MIVLLLAGRRVLITGSSSVTFTNCNIYSNQAGFNGAGGGVHIQGGTIAFYGCNIYSNQAASGGGVAILGGTVMFTSCNIYSNMAKTNWKI